MGHLFRIDIKDYRIQTNPPIVKGDALGRPVIIVQPTRKTESEVAHEYAPKKANAYVVSHKKLLFGGRPNLEAEIISIQYYNVQ
jgi:hypothetical protein